MVKYGDNCPLCGKGTMRHANPETWGQGLNEEGKIDRISYQLKCSNCPHTEASEHLTEDPVVATDSVKAEVVRK